MQFDVAPVFPAPEMARIESEIARHDPAAVVDYDPSRMALRLSTCLPADEVAQALNRAGLAVDTTNVRRLPSECCGGCGC